MSYKTMSCEVRKATENNKDTARLVHSSGVHLQWHSIITLRRELQITFGISPQFTVSFPSPAQGLELPPSQTLRCGLSFLYRPPEHGYSLMFRQQPSPSTTLSSLNQFDYNFVANTITRFGGGMGYRIIFCGGQTRSSPQR